MRVQAKSFGIARNAVEARFMEPAVFQVPPDILPMKPGRFREVVIRPVLFFHSQNDLAFEP